VAQVVPIHRSAEPLDEGLRQDTGSTLVQQDDTAAIHVRVELDRPAELSHDQVGEPHRPPVQSAACMNGPAVVAVGGTLIVPQRNRWNPLTVASSQGNRTGDNAELRSHVGQRLIIGLKGELE
jgi:hypothetical protein